MSATAPPDDLSGPRLRARLLLLAIAVPQAFRAVLVDQAVDPAPLASEWASRATGRADPGGVHASRPLRLSKQDVVGMLLVARDLEPERREALVEQAWLALAPAVDLIVLVEDDPDDYTAIEWKLLLQQPQEAPGADDLVALLRAEPRVAAVCFDDPWRTDAFFDWPLQIGIADGADAEELLHRFQGGRHAELYDVFVAGADHDAVDLLLWPGTAAAALVEDRRPRSTAIVLLGATTGQALSALRDVGWRSGAVAACDVPAAEQRAWLQVVVRELSHNRPWPAALFTAALAEQRRWDGPDRPLADFGWPLVVGDGEFLLERSRIAVSAQRLATAIDRIDDEEGETFRRRAADFAWQNETGDASTLVRTRRAVEAQRGSIRPILLPREPAPVPRMGGDANPSIGLESIEFQSTPTPTPTPTPERHVQATLQRTDGSDATTALLVPGTPYDLFVHIGPLTNTIVIAADRALDEARLPPSADGHELTIVYCPLTPVREDDGTLATPAPQRRTLHLPPAGSSDTVRFGLRTGSGGTMFRSRLIVSFANRVLQTLLLDNGDDSRLRLREENVYLPTLAPERDTPPAQVAFVINDDPSGRPGLATMTLASSTFVDSRSLAVEIAAIETILTEANEEQAGVAEPALDDAGALQRLRGLAMHGSLLLQQLEDLHGADVLRAASHVQLVEAVAEAFFPVEFLYEGIAPLPDAALCPHARDALRDATASSSCPNAANDEFVCPARFWGLQKFIERLPSRRLPSGQAAPAAAAARLGPFQRALLGASAVAAAQMHPDTGLPARLRRPDRAVVTAKDWKDWKTQIAALSPDLIILMAHSLEFPTVPDMAALEISRAHLPASSVAPSYVVGGQGPPGPLLLLLGCSTMLTKAPFLNFVRHFQRAGAPVVVGTLARIHATQSAMIAERFLQRIEAQATPRRFDEALRDFKRELLGDGHQGALALVSYGHASWRI